MIDYEVSDRISVLRLNAPPLNTITLDLLKALCDSVRRAGDDRRVSGIAIVGSAEHFSAGADLNLFRHVTSAAEAAPISQQFQQMFAMVEDSKKPIAAAVAGNVMGGALELAVACHYRVACRGTRFSVPEVQFGFCPGAGATQRLPRLVGADIALRMLIGGKLLDADEALNFGLVDAVCEPGELVDASCRLLATADPRRTSELQEKVQDARRNEAAIEEARAQASRSRPELIAPRETVEAVEVGLRESAQAGFDRECRAFAECAGTPAAQNKLYVFFAARAMGKAADIEQAEPFAVQQAAVVGMGSMGTGIVQALVSAGLPVTVCDQSEEAIVRGINKIKRSLARRVEQGRLTPEQFERTFSLITPSEDRVCLADADLVIESVFEDVEIKREVLVDLARHCRPDTVLATNTSTISLDVLAEGMQSPERLIGMHFFNPAHRMPLVEVIRRRSTSARVVATVMGAAKRLGKRPVLVNNREGFLVNRIFIPYLKEAFWLLAEGAEPGAIDTAMVEFGFSMGPLVLTDMAGVDILVDTDRVLTEAFPQHGPISPIATRLVKQGQLGQKTGGGVYRYDKGDFTPHESETTRKMIAEMRHSLDSQRRPGKELTAAEIAERLVLRMVSEAFRVVEENVAQSESDVDAAMVLGTGFPDFRGGIIRYGRSLGLDTLRSRLDNLADTVGERYAPCRLLREM